MSEVNCACRGIDAFECYNLRHPLTIDDCMREIEREDRRNAECECECSCHDQYFAEEEDYE